MNGWMLDYWKPSDKKNSPVKKEVEKLIKDKVRRQQFTKLVLGVEEFGPYGFTTKGNKHLGAGLFELRDTSKHTRYYYCETGLSYDLDGTERKSILLLMVADGNKDMQSKAIELARSRMAEVGKKNILNDDSLNIVESE